MNNHGLPAGVARAVRWAVTPRPGGGFTLLQRVTLSACALYIRVTLRP